MDEIVLGGPPQVRWFIWINKPPKGSLSYKVLNFFSSEVRFFDSNLKMVMLGMLALSFLLPQT